MSTYALSQATYNMSNDYIIECEGTLIDSEAGEDPEIENGYAHNEDFVFTVCVPNSDGFTITFSAFFLEEDFDFLRIYDGASTNDPLLGAYTGNVIPGTITTTSDCITFHFESDANISAPGFELSWEAVPPDPIPPVFNANPNVTCESTEVTLTLDVPIPCNEVKPGNFQFNAPSGSSIATATPVNCVGGETSQIKLTFNTPLDESGRYRLTFTVNYTDVCDNNYTFEVSTFFDIIDCPLELDLLGNSLVCEGGCVTLFADASGGNPFTYVFDWNNGTPGPATRKFCPTSDTIIYVTVSDDSPSPSATDSIILTMIPSPTAATPIDTACRNDPDFFLSASPTGGSWTGLGIIDANTGQFRPRQASNGNNNIIYYAPNGCTDTVPIFILPINPGPTDVTCVNTSTFLVRGGNPSGGTWSGSPQIDINGNYTPPEVAMTDTVTYNAPNGCTAKKLVKVVDSVSVQLPDTLCINDPAYNLAFSPIGGIWSVSFSPNGTNGITNNRQGTFNPAIAGGGKHLLNYTVFGCYDSTSVSVLDIDAGLDEFYCPEQDTFRITTGFPSGGIWTGTGILDTISGLFDPGFNNDENFTTTLNYSLQGCVDQKIIYVYQSKIDKDTISFCDYDSPTTLAIKGTTGIPAGGIWSGIGMSPYDNINPQLFDTNFTYIYYTVNTCKDSLVVQIHPTVTAQKDTVVCPSSPDFNLEAKPLGGLWTGYGITDANAGTFSPPLTGNGIYLVNYTLNGCTDQVQVTVDSLNIEFLDDKTIYCYNSTPITLAVDPSGGTWSGPGIINNFTGEFVSAIAGEGIHTLFYSFGSAECAVEDSLVIQVRAKLVATMMADTTPMCYGDSRELTILGSGGYGILGYEYSWSHDLPNQQTVTITADTTTTYMGYVDDNCSDTGIDSIKIIVYNEIMYNPPTLNDTVCYGDLTWGEVVPVVDTFLVSWNTDPVITTTRADNILHGEYEVTITNPTTGCSRIVPIRLPNYPYLRALFDHTPLGCINLPDTMIYFIDYSSGAESGTWNFEEISGFTTLPYTLGSNPSRIYLDTGLYTVDLTVMNGYGTTICVKTYTDSICVLPPLNRLLPDAFTPNGDGINDFFPRIVLRNGKWVPNVSGATDYEMHIYDRWGELVYRCDGTTPPWNGGWGNDPNNMVPSGVYSYLIKIDYEKPFSEKRIGKVVVLR
ncbi:MAG: gliding motility-associated-like protein [Flavobacteriales bacterium]|jgi:gliding motility-associated-like protein